MHVHRACRSSLHTTLVVGQAEADDICKALDTAQRCLEEKLRLWTPIMPQHKELRQQQINIQLLRSALTFPER